MDIDEAMGHARNAHQKFRGWHWLGQFVIGVVMILVLVAVAFYGYRGLFYTWVDNYQFGYVYDYWSGAQYPVPHNGYVYSPFYAKAVHTIDLRPMQVCIGSSRRIANCKQVHFDPYAVDPGPLHLKGWEIFIKWHGRGNYQGPGNPSASSAGADNSVHTPFSEILLSYSYDGNTYPFLVVDKEMKSDAPGQIGNGVGRGQ